MKSLSQQIIESIDETKNASTLLREARQITPEFVDLGLPSGTLWFSVNEQTAHNRQSNEYYSHDDATRQFGRELPTYEDFEELFDNCDYKFIGYKGAGSFKGIWFISRTDPKKKVYFEAKGGDQDEENFRNGYKKYARSQFAQFWTAETKNFADGPNNRLGGIIAEISSNSGQKADLEQHIVPVDGYRTGIEDIYTYKQIDGKSQKVAYSYENDRENFKMTVYYPVRRVKH